MTRTVSAPSVLLTGPEPPATGASQLTTSTPSLAGTYERRLTRADIERTDHLRDESFPNQEKPQPGQLELTLEKGTLTMTDVGAGVTIRQDFSATSDGAFRIGAYRLPIRGASAGRTSPRRRPTRGSGRATCSAWGLSRTSARTAIPS